VKDSTKDQIKAFSYLASFFAFLAIAYFIGNYFSGVGRRIVTMFLIVAGSLFVVMIICSFWNPSSKE
jgi:hypothetical protein